MYSASLTNTTHTMRPGLLAGRFPERETPPKSWAHRLGNTMQGLCAGFAIRRPLNLRKITAAINDQGKALETESTAALHRLRDDLRGQLYRHGLTEKLGIQAFALIREMSARTLQMRHYDAQLQGGWVLLQGQLAEMETGEGKTLAATLAAATVAMAGVPVHVITANEYLVQRDAADMGPLYHAMGLTVGHVTEAMPPAHRQANYACDITYCTNKQVAFDYLRDRLQLGRHRSQLRMQLQSAYPTDSHSETMLRGLCYAIVDEADSVLIDEARTPLIITRQIESKQQQQTFRQALEIASQMLLNDDFRIEATPRQIQITQNGRGKLAGRKLDGDRLWQHPVWREHLIGQALHCLHLLKRDRDYLIKDDKILIIDANTGRTMPDRSWEGGLHQMVEVKEGCPLSAHREQLGRLTYQQFFRRYIRLAGMTGTAREVRFELWSVYGLGVRRIDLHRPSRRKKLPTFIYRRASEKWDAVVASVRALIHQDRPVLIGTHSVADSEGVSRRLTAAAIPHRVLNARQDQKEAEIIAAAGNPRRVTVATNMAGRGTDILLADAVTRKGGLHVITTCRNEAGRIDRQLYGRCARQGDPGSHQAILSLEDDLIKQYGSRFLLGLSHLAGTRRSFFTDRLHRFIARQAQRKIERRHRRARRTLIRHEKQISRLLFFSGQME